MGTAPLRVLHIVAGLAISRLGGIERFGVQLVQAFDQRRVVPVLCGLWSFDLEDERYWIRVLAERGVKALVAAKWRPIHPYRNFWNAVHGIVRRVETPVDIVHSHQEFGDIAAVLLKRPLRARTLLRTVHNEREWPRRLWRRWLLTHFLWVFLFDHEFGVSRQVVSNLDTRPIARLVSKRSTIAYNALDLTRFTTSMPYTRYQVAAMWQLPPHGTWLISIGRFTEQKGYHILLDALRHVASLHNNVHLVLIGSGPLKDELRTQARQMGLSSIVRFSGIRRDIERLLPAFDLFVSSSLWEGLPTVVLEAAAAKVPIVATKVSGTVEILEHGRLGFLVPPGDSLKLAEAILYMLSHPLEAQQMAARAYQHVKGKFSVEQVARKYEQFYEEFL
ncbi:MAG: glycosyltransferase [Ardenticatenia bacterium]|nr:glycosyltransferase [Ardenticatenia bacterium]